jgi:hypothetical protein
MNWLPATPYFQPSEDGRFSVAKVFVGGKQTYELWKTRHHEDGPGCIAVNLPSAEAARQACETHERTEA